VLQIGDSEERNTRMLVALTEATGEELDGLMELKPPE
jgi:hypothetical protein